MNRVLLRSIGLRRKHKITDQWGGEPYSMVKRMGDLSVCEIAPEAGSGQCWVVHRNLILPIRELHGPSPAKRRMPHNRPWPPRTIQPREGREPPPPPLEDPDSESNYVGWYPSKFHHSLGPTAPGGEPAYQVVHEETAERNAKQGNDSAGPLLKDKLKPVPPIHGDRTPVSRTAPASPSLFWSSMQDYTPWPQ